MKSLNQTAYSPNADLTILSRAPRRPASTHQQRSVRWGTSSTLRPHKILALGVYSPSSPTRSHATRKKSRPALFRDYLISIGLIPGRLGVERRYSAPQTPQKRPKLTSLLVDGQLRTLPSPLFSPTCRWVRQ